jgi:hypothetical protein
LKVTASQLGAEERSCRGEESTGEKEILLHKNALLLKFHNSTFEAENEKNMSHAVSPSSNE